jgi:hypothetical protein
MEHGVRIRLNMFEDYAKPGKQVLNLYALQTAVSSWERRFFFMALAIRVGWLGRR